MMKKLFLISYNGGENLFVKFKLLSIKLYKCLEKINQEVPDVII